MAAHLADIGAAPMLDTLRSPYVDDLGDATGASPEDVEADGRRGFEEVRARAGHPQYVGSVADEGAWWRCFQPGRIDADVYL